MPIDRVDIEKALDLLISHEAGFQFQSLAVVLARQRWPGLIAHDRKKDKGLDAYEPASLQVQGKGHGLACSISKDIFDKIKGDAKEARTNFRDLRVLTFATPWPVTQQTALKWAKELQKIDGATDVELFVMAREDIITSLLEPKNEGFCRTHLGMPPAETPQNGNVLERVLAATAEIAGRWRDRTHKGQRPTVALTGVALDDQGRETDQTINETALRSRLNRSQRTWLEAPGGRGKTTTLARLALAHQSEGEVFLLIDMASWIRSRQNILEFVAQDIAFQSRDLSARDLAGLRERVHFSFLLNGWNEITASQSENAVVAVEDLDRNYPNAGIIIATRVQAVIPQLPGSLRVRLLSFTRAQRKAYLSAVLGDRAEELRQRVDGSAVLDDLTRTPLLLDQVISLFESGAPIPETKVGVLGAATKLLEANHRSRLQGPPLSDRAGLYLSELAHEMTRQGSVLIGETEANRTIQPVVAKLAADGLFIVPPAPAGVLQELCAHHVLERVEEQTVVYRFQHQQFQEFYASRFLAEKLEDIARKQDATGNLAFSLAYIDQPLWQEPLFMVAENIGHLLGDERTKERGETTGARLIELASEIDPVFAGDLAYLGGPLLWPVVRSGLSTILRKWYEAKDRAHQSLALAGMLATGSADFLDIVGPMFASQHRNRIRVFNNNILHLSSFGPDWRSTIAEWSEDARRDFIFDMSHSPQVAGALEELALTDPSAKVRRSAFEGLYWHDAAERLDRVVGRLDDAALETMLPGIDDAVLSPANQTRVVEALRRSITPEMSVLRRLALLMRSQRFGANVTIDELKAVLDSQVGRFVGDYTETLRSVLDAIKAVDPDWVSSWISTRLLDNSLSGDHWNGFLRTMEAGTRTSIVEELATKNVDYPKLSAYRGLFAAETTPDGAAALFTKLAEYQRLRAAKPMASTWKLESQLTEALRAIPLDLVVEGITRCLAEGFDAGKGAAVTELFGRVNPGAEDIREKLTEAQRQPLRLAIKETIVHALDNNVLSGESRAHAAVALGRLGDAEDFDDIKMLVDADIRRLNEPLQPGRGLVMHANWLILGLQWLNPPGLEDYLLEILKDPYYERYVSQTLLQIAVPMAREGAFVRGVPFDEIWKRRESSDPPGVDIARATRYADALRQRIEHHNELRSVAGGAANAIGRMKELAFTLAVIDGKRSADLIMEVMQLPGDWDENARMGAVRALLISGAALTTDAIFAVLNPAIERLFERGIYQDQQFTLLMDCLELLPFGDDPARGIARIRQVLRRLKVRAHNVEGLIVALGYSRSKAAVPLLIDLGKGPGGLDKNAVHWVQAFGRLATGAARRTLLGYVDPAVPDCGVTLPYEFNLVPELAKIIAEWAREDAGLRNRLVALAREDLPRARKVVLVSIYAELEEDETLLADPFLMGSSFFVSGDGPEELYIGRKQYDETGSYTLEPRNAEALRARLFQLALDDPTRRPEALSALARIEVSRHEVGRPPTEPRHPKLESGKPWPPLDFLNCE